MKDDRKQFMALCHAVRLEPETPPETSPAAPPSPMDADQYVSLMRSCSLRVTATLTPVLHKAVAEVAERVRLAELPEVFVYNDPAPSASAPLITGDGPAVVVLSSGMVHLLSPAEIRHVLGHELAHMGLGHRGQDTSRPAGSDPKTWQRAAEQYTEISADRVGLIACRSLQTAAMAMVKTMSGLTDRHVTLDVPAFLQQLQDQGQYVDRSSELFATHPSLPLRLWALIAFAESDTYVRLAQTGQVGRPLAEVDLQVRSMLEDLRRREITRAQNRQVNLAAAWLGTAAAVGAGLDRQAASRLLAAIVGADTAERAFRFTQEFGLEAAAQKLREALKEVAASGEPAGDKFAILREALAAAGVDVRKAPIYYELPSDLRQIVG